MERIGCLDDDKGWAGDQVMGLEQAVDGCCRDEIALGIGKRHRQFPRRQLRLIQSQAQDLVADIVRDTVPHPAGTTGAVLKTGFAEGSVAIVPSVECTRRNAQLVQGAPDRQVGASVAMRSRAMAWAANGDALATRISASVLGHSLQ